MVTMTPPIPTSIRPYTPADADDLIHVWRRAATIAHDFLPQAFMQQEEIAIREQYLPHTDTWVALHAHRIIGFIALLGNEIGGLFVDPEAQRQGVGRALLSHARAQRANDSLTVEVFAKNLAAVAFYERCGFIHGAVRPHEPTNEQLCVLELGG